jgi:ABC-type ATPase with predicted acetyltransferase domain
MIARVCARHGEWVDDGTTSGCPDCLVDELVQLLAGRTRASYGIEVELARPRQDGPDIVMQVRVDELLVAPTFGQVETFLTYAEETFVRAFGPGFTVAHVDVIRNLTDAERKW